MINDSDLLDIQLQIRDSRIIQIHIYEYIFIYCCQLHRKINSINNQDLCLTVTIK